MNFSSKNNRSLYNTPSFIEQQFPVAKVSVESYKERMANNGQTLTGLGKWWGRKPLGLVRAVLVGLLMPSSEDFIKDREIFLKIMTMDESGLLSRKYKSIPESVIVGELKKMQPSIRKRFLGNNNDLNKLSRTEKSELQQIIFKNLPHSEKIKYCLRPEQIAGPAQSDWDEINNHLKTHANNLPELIQELGEKKFNHIPFVGDCFCGGGSIPFEAARLGCETYASDLNPVATLLTWASINILGGSQEIKNAVHQCLTRLYHDIDKKIMEWGIETNEHGWRADGYLYCTEVIDPESGWKVPLAPSWVIGQGTKTIATLKPNYKEKRYDIVVMQGVSDDEMEDAKSAGTLKDSRLCPPSGGQSTPIETIRHGLRMWENHDLVPQADDVFRERLYCIQWAEITKDKSGKSVKVWHYEAPTQKDLEREEKVLNLLKERFVSWQKKGYIPSRKIVPEGETARLQREKGWTYWHHLFTPRQLLLCGLVMEYMDENKFDTQTAAMALLGLGRCLNYMSRLSTWHSAKGNENVERVFTNQALNTLHNYASRSWVTLQRNFLYEIPDDINCRESTILPLDARQCLSECDIWITDPPYADAINYEEITEFFFGLV